MSRPFRGKNKDLVNLEVVTADKVWTKTKTGKPTLRKDIEIFGRVDKGTSAFVTSTNLTGKNHRIVEDTNALPKRVKNGVVSVLKNDNRSVAYLVKKQNKENKK